MNGHTPNDRGVPRRHRTLIVIDLRSCGADAFERLVSTMRPAETDARAVVLAGRSEPEIHLAVQMLHEVTHIAQRHGFRASGWNVVRSARDLADDLLHSATFDRAELVAPPSRWSGSRYARVRRVVRRRGARPHLACATA